jgi:hypothetical protein
VERLAKYLCKDYWAVAALLTAVNSNQ